MMVSVRIRDWEMHYVTDVTTKIEITVCVCLCMLGEGHSCHMIIAVSLCCIFGS